MSELRFNSETHEYCFGEKPVPSVTEILDSCGFVNTFCQNSEIARKYGNAVHKVVELDIKGSLDETTLDHGLKNPLLAWRAFSKDFPFIVPIKGLVEKPMYNSSCGYAGTPDVPCKDEKGRLLLLDIKTSETVQPYWDIQTEAYCRMIKKNYGEDFPGQYRRWVIMLSHKSAKYRIEKCNNPLSWQIFLSALTVYRWRKQAGLLKNES